MDNSGWSFRKRGRSFIYAAKGIAQLLRQPNACIHSAVAVFVLFASWWFEISAVEWCLVLLCIGGVLMAEGFNTAIETLADRVSPGYDRLVGKCKDVAAGAVLLLVLAVVVVGLIIFLPKVLALF